MDSLSLSTACKHHTYATQPTKTFVESIFPPTPISATLIPLLGDRPSAHRLPPGRASIEQHPIPASGINDESSSYHGGITKNACLAVAALVSALVVVARAESPAPPKTGIVEDKIVIKRTLQTITIPMARIPAGEIVMPPLKDGQQPRTVQIKNIWMAQTELPWAAYDPYALCRDLSLPEKLKAKDKDLNLRPSNPYADPGYDFRFDDYAVRSIHPLGAVDYCKWLSQLTGKKYRLPTEAEWEYACRAGRPAEDLKDADAHAKAIDGGAWVAENSKDGRDPVPHPVGQKTANPWGLHDMLGNIAEWAVAEDGTYVLKGGWYDDPAKDVHSRARVALKPAMHQQKDPNSPKSKWWLSDCKQAGFRVIRED